MPNVRRYVVDPSPIGDIYMYPSALDLGRRTAMVVWQASAS
ncbi:MAG: hypothetical protein OXF96_09680 [Chloroflexi bacterium]|nr:hypothetical protein [Chloroflexota bacterium]